MFLLRRPLPGVTMGLMETVVTVQARSEAEAERWLEKLRTIGLEPVSAPKQPVGRDRWMVRARPAAQSG